MSWCRHYPKGGMGDNTHCNLGIEMRALRDESVRPFRFPCVTAGAEHLCVKFEGYTAEEIAEEDRQWQEFENKMVAIEARESEDCPHCGMHVNTMQQVGRCVYLRPCNCRLWQGRIPTAWKAGS